ncbi:MAG: magnesium transporter, partial [Wenzhouxiangellaceae bacterium]
MSDDQMQLEPESGQEVLDKALINSVLEAVEADDAVQVAELLEPLHAADVADLIEQISASDREALVGIWGDHIDGDVLSELDESIREPVIQALPADVLADAVKELDSDDVVDLVEDLEHEQQSRILEVLEAVDRLRVESSLSYPEYSAGRLMQRELVAVPEDWTVGQTIDFLRSNEDLPAQFYHIILVSPAMKPGGYVALGRLLSSRRAESLLEISEPSFRTVTVDEQESEVAYLFNHYHLISAPVVDENGRLVGVITIDDAMNVLDEEHEEDMLRMAGVDEDSSLSDSVLQTTRGRAVWLAVNLVTAIVASMVIALFSDEIDKLVALAVLMPIVASMGGNAGTQTMTVAVRAIATRELTSRNTMRVALREIMVGALNGIGFGIIMALVAAFWFGVPMLAVVIAVAMAFTLVAAAL